LVHTATGGAPEVIIEEIVPFDGKLERPVLTMQGTAICSWLI